MGNFQQREMDISQRKNSSFNFPGKVPKRFLGKFLFFLECYIMPLGPGGQKLCASPSSERRHALIEHLLCASLCTRLIVCMA